MLEQNVLTSESDNQREVIMEDNQFLFGFCQNDLEPPQMIALGLLWADEHILDVSEIRPSR